MTRRTSTVRALRPPRAKPSLDEVLLAIKKVDRTVLEFQKTTGATLERLLPMTEAVRQAVIDLSEKVGRVEDELEAVKRRVAALEQRPPTPTTTPGALPA